MQLPENHPPIDMANKVAALEQLAREKPSDSDIKTQIANAYYDMGTFDKAVQFYEESLRLRPNDPAVQTDLATSYHYLGQHDKALQLLEQVLKEHPGFAQALYNKGVILQDGKRDVAGAIAVWEALLRTDPNYAQRAELEKRISELKSGMR
jgi:cytochrome c-type biogenesis protein CcmH/NrfG